MSESERERSRGPEKAPKGWDSSKPLEFRLSREELAEEERRVLEIERATNKGKVYWVED